MQKHSEAKARHRLGLWLIGVLLCFFAFYKNSLTIAPPDLFKIFQHDSESLVLGKILAEKNGLPVGHGANLAYVTVGEFAYDPGHVYQSYDLLDAAKLPELTLSLVDLTDDNWTHGFLRKGEGVLLPTGSGISRYVGHRIQIGDGKVRFIKSAYDNGRYVTVILLGPSIEDAKSTVANPIQISGEPPARGLLQAYAYLSQYGLQGKVFSWLINDHDWRLRSLHKLNALLLALTITALASLYARIICREFAVLFFISILLSPWIVLFAKNLYWVPFTWFLPALFAAGYYIAESNTGRAASLALLFLAFLLKCLCGYEYISSVILFAAAVFGLDVLRADGRFTATEAFKRATLVCVIGVLAFGTALLMHAGMRGDSVLSGLAAIYEQDVKRRTYADPASFPPIFAQSLLASPWQVLRTYIVDWNTELWKGVAGKYFVLLIMTSIATVSYKFCTKHATLRRDLALLIAFALPASSWFILAKGHSFIHTHLNYALWYLGFCAACLYVTYNGSRILVIRLAGWLRSARETDY